MEKLDSILAKYRSDDWQAELWDRSPFRLDGSPSEDWHHFVEYLYPASDIIWLGEHWQSGSTHGGGRFRKTSEWLRFPKSPGSRIAPSTFKEGASSRSKENIASHLYLVLESDELIGRKPETDAERQANKTASAALFRWLEVELRMHLAAVIDTGNRSLHGWFTIPKNPQVTRELQVIAKTLRLDSNLLSNPAAPLRMPGCVHEKTGCPAELLYLDHMTQL